MSLVNLANDRTESGSDTELSRCVERELGSFLTAVAQLYGPEQVNDAAEDWMDEFALQELPQRDLPWQITIAAAMRLAQRLNSR